MNIVFYDQFWFDQDIPRSRVFELLPDVYRDNRGFFLEVLKHKDGPLDVCHWYGNMSWIKQINRSVSGPGVARGLHAQSGAFCQGKLV